MMSADTILETPLTVISCMLPSLVIRTMVFGWGCLVSVVQETEPPARVVRKRSAWRSVLSRAGVGA